MLLANYKANYKDEAIYKSFHLKHSVSALYKAFYLEYSISSNYTVEEETQLEDSSII